jgi:hypothetical protein
MKEFELFGSSFSQSEINTAIGYFSQDYFHSFRSLNGCFKEYQKGIEGFEKTAGEKDLLLLCDVLILRAKEDVLRADMLSQLDDRLICYLDKDELLGEVDYSKHVISIARTNPRDFKEILRLENLMNQLVLIEDYEGASLYRDLLKEIRGN